MERYKREFKEVDNRFKIPYTSKHFNYLNDILKNLKSQGYNFKIVKETKLPGDSQIRGTWLEYEGNVFINMDVIHDQTRIIRLGIGSHILSSSIYDATIQEADESDIIKAIISTIEYIKG